MDSILKYAGVVALVILAIMSVAALSKGGARSGSATVCPGGVTCFTNLEAQGTFAADGATSLAALSATTISGTAVSATTVTTTGALSVASSSPSALGDAVISGTGTTTLMFGGSKSCIQMVSSAGAPVAVYVNGTTVTATAGTCK
jgi:hypothetical protein